MKIIGGPWQVAWHEDGISEKFFQELSRLEKGAAKDMTVSAVWAHRLAIELGQLAQNMIQLETDEPHEPQIRLAYDRSLKLSALAAYFAMALHQVDKVLRDGGVVDSGPFDPNVVSAVEAATQQAEAGGMPHEGEVDLPEPSMRHTIRSLTERGMPVDEIEAVTGQSRRVIEGVIAEE